LELQRKNEIIVSKERILTLFETNWNCIIVFENDVSKACILMIFETIWNWREKQWKHCF